MLRWALLARSRGGARGGGGRRRGRCRALELLGVTERSREQLERSQDSGACRVRRKVFETRARSTMRWRIGVGRQGLIGAVRARGRRCVALGSVDGAEAGRREAKHGSGSVVLPRWGGACSAARCRLLPVTSSRFSLLQNRAGEASRRQSSRLQPAPCRLCSPARPPFVSVPCAPGPLRLLFPGPLPERGGARRRSIPSCLRTRQASATLSVTAHFPEAPSRPASSSGALAEGERPDRRLRVSGAGSLLSSCSRLRAPGRRPGRAGWVPGARPPPPPSKLGSPSGVGK